jgi:anthraniloyl-CoA monooxygenase
VEVIGGGPGGLYFALLLKRDHPGYRVHVIERDRPDETYGFGVAFQEKTLKALADADPDSRREIDALLCPWTSSVFHVRGMVRRAPNPLSGCARRDLLGILQRRAAAVGVELEFGRKAVPRDAAGADLVVVADGAASTFRDHWREHFEPQVSLRPNRYVWLGCTRPEQDINFRFKQRPEGLFFAHTYPYRPDASTWIIETTQSAYERLGLANFSEQDTSRFVADLYADELQGHQLVTNRSYWRQFPLVSCRRWVKDNIVLLGDAKGTAHFSIGSGTKLAMEDAVALHTAFGAPGSVPQKLAQYEAQRRPVVQALQSMAHGSMLWFEQIDAHWGMRAPRLIFSGITRKANETYEGLRAGAPDLVRDAEAAYMEDLASQTLTVDSSLPPFRQPFQLRGLKLANRIAVGCATGPGAQEAERLSLADADRSGAALVCLEALDVSRPLPGMPWARIAASARGVKAGKLYLPLSHPKAATPEAAKAFAAAARQAVEAGVAMIALEFAPCPGNDAAYASAALDSFCTIRKVWPADMPVAARMAGTGQSESALELARMLAGAGCDLIDVSDGADGEDELAGRVVFSNTLRHLVGVPTLCKSPESSNDINALLLADRANLVLLSPARLAQIGMQ